MEEYIGTYCTRCAQLQWHAHIGKGCEFCGSTIFANVRPKPFFTRIDKRILGRLDIPADKDSPKGKT